MLPQLLKFPTTTHSYLYDSSLSLQAACKTRWRTALHGEAHMPNCVQWYCKLSIVTMENSPFLEQLKRKD